MGDRQRQEESKRCRSPIPEPSEDDPVVIALRELGELLRPAVGQIDAGWDVLKKEM